MSKIFKIEYRYKVPTKDAVDRNYLEIIDEKNNLIEQRKITLTYESIVNVIFKYINEINELEQAEGNLDKLYSNMIDTVFYQSTLKEQAYIKYLRLEFGEKSQIIESFFTLVDKKYNEYLRDYCNEMSLFINVYTHLIRENYRTMEERNEGYLVSNFKSVISLRNSDKLTKQNITSKSLRLYINSKVLNPLALIFSNAEELGDTLREYVYFTRIHPDYLDYVYADLKYLTAHLDKFNVTFAAKKFIEYLDVANYEYTDEEKEEYKYLVSKINDQIEENNEALVTYFGTADFERLLSTREIVKTTEKNISNNFDKFIYSLYDRVVGSNNKELFNDIYTIFQNGDNQDVILDEFKKVLIDNDLKAYAIFTDNIVDNINKNMFVQKFTEYFNSATYKAFSRKLSDSDGGFERERE